MNLAPLLFGIGLFVGLHSESPAACLSSEPESVDSFMQQFMASKKFSASRTLYPYVVVVESEEGQQQEVVTKSGDAKSQPLADYIRENEMAFAIEDRKAERATLRVFAPNTGYSMRYRFTLKHGCWFLKSVSVVSM